MGENNEKNLALAEVKMASYKKKVNAESWNDDYEELIASWGEKAAGLKFMHSNSASYWKGLSNKLTLYSIVATTVASAASLIAGSLNDVVAKDVILFTAGGIGLFTSFIQSLKKFYNAEEKGAEHASIAKQFDSYYRYITLQMGQSREDRRPSDELSEWALKEYERLQQEALPLGSSEINKFLKTFKDSKQSIPDVCRKDFTIRIYDNATAPESTN